MHSFHAALLLVLLQLASCASPVEGLWPPKPGEPTHRLILAVQGWHSTIGIKTGGRYVEWGYADKTYYYDTSGKIPYPGRCFGEPLTALFWPTYGVVEMRYPEGPFDERHGKRSYWEFPITERGYQRLLKFLARENDWKRLGPRGGVEFCVAHHDYHAFHHCHHWTTRALREAGLPVWSIYSLFRWSLEMQLDRAKGFLETR